ncbi:unnamed protein product [Effrenium voratum]|nr:unnamed protein product [Effrenium voratum]
MRCVRVPWLRLRSALPLRQLRAAAAKAPGAQPLLVSPTGAPLSAGAAGTAGAGSGGELAVTPENAAQVLQSPSPFLLVVGELDAPVAKKLDGLRKAAQGRLPLIRLDCKVLPQVCQALQITSSPTVLLMAKGQVVAGLERDLSPPTATAFVENVAQMLGLKVDLAEAATEQLNDAEELEWTDAAAAEQTFSQVLSRSDLPNDARIRALAGRARCLLRQRSGQEPEAKALLEQLQSAGQGGLPEVKQAVAMLWIDQKQRELGETNLQTLKAAWEAAPTDLEVVQAYAVSVFWAHGEADAFEAGLSLLRKKRSDEARQLVLSLVEALGPRHPKGAAARRQGEAPRGPARFLGLWQPLVDVPLAFCTIWVQGVRG